MRRLLTTFTLLLVAVIGVAHAAPKRTLGVTPHRSVGYLTQTITLNGDNTFTARIAPLTTSDSGFGLDRVGTNIAFPVNALPGVQVANPTSQVAALDAAVQWMDAFVPQFRVRIGRWMKDEGLSSTFYTFTQEIMVRTEAGQKKKAISFFATIDQDGRPLHGKPKIVDPDPTILQAMYVPLRAVEGLPSTWRYPNAGQIQWRILNKKFEPITPWKYTDTGGAFDSTIDAANSDAQVNCLMDRGHASCSGPTDIKTMLDSTGASFAVVDYIRQLEPVYDEMPDGELVAKGAISVDARIWDCVSYVNRGAYGYLLTLQAERYLARPNGALLTPQLLSKMATKGISPTEPYQKQVPITALNGRHPDGYFINPHPDMTDLWSKNDPAAMKNIIYLAPVTAGGGDGVLSAASFSGDMTVQQLSGSGGIQEYYIGTVADNYWGTGDYPRTVTFNISAPQSLDEMSIVEEGFDDYLLVAVNGTTVYNGPYGGDMLSMGSGSQSNQTNCSPSGSRWSCSETVTTAPTPDPKNPLSAGTCPAGYSLSGSWDSGYVCTTTVTNTFDYCTSGYGGGENPSYVCGNGCPSYMVQWLSGATASGWGSFHGCSPVELNHSWHTTTRIDLRPYLVSGTNTLFMHTIVGGAGEGWIKVRTQACGSSLGLPHTDPPPVPADAGAPGVDNSLKNQY